MQLARHMMQSYTNQFLHRTLASAAGHGSTLGTDDSNVRRTNSDSTLNDNDDRSVQHLIEAAAAAYQATSAGKRAQCGSKPKLISEKSLAEATARRCQKIQSKIDQMAQEKELYRIRTLQERKERYRQIVEQTRPTVRKRPASSRIQREQETLRRVQGEASQMVDAAIDNPVPTAHAAEVTSMLKYKGMWDGSHHARIVKGSAVEVAESAPNNFTDKERLETASVYSSPASSRTASPSHANPRRPTSPRSPSSLQSSCPTPAAGADSRNPSPMPTTPRPHSSTTYPVPLPVSSTKKSLTPTDPTAMAPSVLTPIHDSLVPPVFPPGADFSDDDDCDLPLGPRPGRGRRGTKKISQKALQLLESNLRLKANRALENMTVPGGGNTSDDREGVVPRLLQPFPKRHSGNRAAALREGKASEEGYGNSSRPSSGVSSSTAIRDVRPGSEMLAAIRPGSARPNAFFIPLDEGRDRPRQPALPTFVRPASDSSRALRPRFANMDDESSGATKSTAHASINTVTEEDLLEDPVAAWASTPAVESTKSRVHRFPGVGINSLAAARHLTLSEPTLASERQEDPRLNSSARMSSRRHLGQQSTGILTAAVGAQDKLEDSAPSSSKRQAFSAPTSGRAPRPGTASRRTQAKLQNTLESIEAFLDPRRPPPSMTRASQQGHSIPVAQPAQRQPVTSRIPLPTPPQHLSFESVAGTPRLPSAIPHTRISTSAPPLPINGTPKNDNAGLQRPTRLTLSAKPSLGTENDDVPTRILKRIVQPVPPTRDELISARVEHRAHFSADVPSPPPPALTHRVSHDLAAMSGNTQLIDEASLVASLTRLSAEIDSRLSQLGVLPAPSLFSASASSAGIGKSSTKPTSLTTSTRSSARIRGSADTLASVESTVSLGRRRMAR